MPDHDHPRAGTVPAASGRVAKGVGTRTMSHDLASTNDRKRTVARVVQMRLVDDIGGSEASETVTISLEEREYELDLSEENAARLRSALAPFVSAARRSGGGRPHRERSSGGGSQPPQSTYDRGRNAEIPTEGGTPRSVSGPVSTVTRSRCAVASQPQCWRPTGTKWGDDQMGGADRPEVPGDRSTDCALAG